MGQSGYQWLITFMSLTPKQLSPGCRDQQMEGGPCLKVSPLFIHSIQSRDHYLSSKEKTINTQSRHHWKRDRASHLGAHYLTSLCFRAPCLKSPFPRTLHVRTIQFRAPHCKTLPLRFHDIWKGDKDYVPKHGFPGRYIKDHISKLEDVAHVVTISMPYLTLDT